MLREVFFDVETRKLFNEIDTQNPADLGLSIISVYDRTVDDSFAEITGSIASFWWDNLQQIWEIFREADRIIGFNTLKFDIPVLAPYAPYDLTKLPHLDMLDIIRNSLGRSISLNHLAQTTLGKAKNDSGVNAVSYWNSQKPENLTKLRKYCEEDVRITRDLYDFGFKNKFLKYTDKWNRLQQVNIDFSYPQKIVDGSKQIGLF